jgi:hypothetical protein
VNAEQASKTPSLWRIPSMRWWMLPVIDVVGFDNPDKGNIVKHLDAIVIMAYSSPEQAIRALAKVQNYYQKRRTRKQY